MSPTIRRFARPSIANYFSKTAPFFSVRQILLLSLLAVVLGSFFVLRFRTSAALSPATSIGAFGSPVTENFNTLVSSGTSSITPAGWGFAETGTGANTQYTASSGGTSSSFAGDTYSFGGSSNSDRAFGGTQSGSVVPTIGASFTNNTGGTVTSLTISYVGEQWRLGTLGRNDRLDFQISTNATNLATGTWTDHNTLDFNAPNSTGVVGPLDGNLPGNRTLISNSISGLSIANGATFFIRWTDFNASGADDGLAVDDFSLTANGVPGDDPPTVSGTSPSNGATGVQADTNITVNFSESVNATSSSFAIECPTGSPQTFTLSASPSNTFILNPDLDLPFGALCTVTVIGNQISDFDTEDPPDQMASNVSFSFTVQSQPPPVIINEIDSDTPSNDTAEFVELYDGGVGNTSLTGLVVVFYNGNGDTSYAAFDLDGYFTDANGYFTLGNPGVPGVDLTFNPGTDGLLQNGADAVALYVGEASSFSAGTPVTLSNLVDAVVYDTADADDPGLLTLVHSGEPQVNENGGGSGTTQSSQRCANGSGGRRNTSTYTQGTPSPDGANNCVVTPPPSGNNAIVISQIYGGGGNPGASFQNDYVELFNRGTTTIDLTGWSLQYASASGSGWDSQKQPLGGTIGPGQYYLIALGSGGPDGAALPPANITGGINISQSNGKLALVSNFDGVVGNCPLADPDLVDFVGYGTADCSEGLTAPSPSQTMAIFRQGGGTVDTNNNRNDFAADDASPRRTAPIVELGPLVLSTDPRTNGINAPRDASMTVTFTEPVTVVDPWFDITCVNSGQHNSATFATTNSGRTHVITPNVNFFAGEQCTATIFASQIHDADFDDGGTNTDTLPANYVWSFTVSTGTAPPYPSSVHLTFGDPGCNTLYGCAAATTAQPANFFMDKPEYSVSYNRDRGTPNWVSWHLSDEWFGTLQRVDTFRPDPQVPAEWYRVQAFDYSGSGFNRGHNTPNADRDKETSIPINQATFLMSNMIPQAPAQNQGPWADMENDLRTIVSSTNEMYVVMGVHGTGGTGDEGFAATIAGGKVTVPATVWKVVLVLPKGENDISRVDCSTRTIAVIIPNSNTATSDWTTYITSVDAVEALTGYNFFQNLPDPYERCVEAGTNGANPPLDTDADGDPDSADNCPLVANADQANFDNDSEGDACDADDDNDGTLDTDEAACGSNPLNAASTCEVCDGIDNDLNQGIDEGFPDNDQDGLADCIDPDDDNDTVIDAIDNCPFVANFDQADADGDGIGNVCDAQTGPPTKDQCKNGGWRFFNFPRTFQNQGDCIQFVNTGK